MAGEPRLQPQPPTHQSSDEHEPRGLEESSRGDINDVVLLAEEGHIRTTKVGEYIDI